MSTTTQGAAAERPTLDDLAWLWSAIDTDDGVTLDDYSEAYAAHGRVLNYLRTEGVL